MHHHHPIALTLFVALGLGLAGCSKTAEPSSTPSVVAAPAADEHAGEHARGEHSPVAVPFVLTMTSRPLTDDGRQVELLVVLEVPRALRDPVELNVKLPVGARLVTGATSETLGKVAAGKVDRRLVVEADAPLTADAPVEVSATLRPQHTAYGAHAARVFPERAVEVRRSRAVPPPPVTRPPVPLQATPALRQ